MGSTTTEFELAQGILNGQPLVSTRFTRAANLRQEFPVGFLEDAPLPFPVKRVAVVALFSGPLLCLGRRNDNGKWTQPGGHFEPDEHPFIAAARETREEAGIELAASSDLVSLGHERVTKPDGEVIEVHCFRADVTGRETDVSNDPDNEVDQWRWVDVSTGLPEAIRANLHVPLEDNVLMKALGLAQMGESRESGVKRKLTRIGRQVDQVQRDVANHPRLAELATALDDSLWDLRRAFEKEDARAKDRAREMAVAAKAAAEEPDDLSTFESIEEAKLFKGSSDLFTFVKKAGFDARPHNSNTVVVTPNPDPLAGSGFETAAVVSTIGKIAIYAENPDTEARFRYSTAFQSPGELQSILQTVFDRMKKAKAPGKMAGFEAYP